MNDAANPFESTAVANRNAALPAVVRSGETASAAVAAQAKAMIESRYVMAMRNPRVMDQVRQDLLKECRRPSFANNKSALYHKPIGKGVEGLGIRFVEVALRCFRNTLNESQMVFADDEREIHRVSITDLESNTTWPMDVTVSRTVERSKPMDDGSYISMRLNSYKKPVYTVPATDDELLNKRGALISKAVRTLGLRVIPGDLQDEAEDIIRAIRLDEAAKDPDAERRKLVDAFGGVGVKASDLIEYLAHTLDACTPAELVELRGIYGSLRDGEATWLMVIENKRALTEQSAGTPPTPEPRTGAAALKAVAEKTAASAPAKKEAVTKVDKNTGETQSQLDDVKMICAAALDIAITENAWLRLDDAKFLLIDMNAENKALAKVEIDAAETALKARPPK
jgi:hypothetical protein